MSGELWGDARYLYVTAALVVMLVLAFALDFARQRRALERLGHAPQLQRMAQSVSRGRRGLKMFLRILGVALVSMALARPRVEGTSEWRQRGIDVALVLDFSKSMLARDVYPSRIRRVKLEVESLLDAFAGDRAAIVAFAGAAVHYPLTTDYEAAKILFRGLEPLDMAPGSDIGEAILTARCMLRPDIESDEDCLRVGGAGDGGAPLSEAEARRHRERRLEITDLGDRARAMVIFTDGEDTEGRAREEVERAATLGIQVFIVGVGTPTGDRIPELDREGRETGWKRGPDGNYVTTRLEESTLRELAKSGGGEDHYYRDDARRIGVEALAKRLRTLKEGDTSQRVIRKPNEAYQWALFPGFLALLVEACLSDRRRGRAKEVSA